MNLLNSLKNKFRSTSKVDYSNINVREDDVFLVSYPKSGNTWMRFLISNLKEDKAISYQDIEKHIPSIYRSLDKLENYNSPRIIKSHHTHFNLYPKTIYIVRDGRDALVSYYHFRQDLHNLKGSFSDFYKLVQKDQFYIYWTKHVSEFLKFHNEFPERALLIRYEDMKSDIYAELKKVCAFCNIQADDEKLKQAIENSDFKKLKSKHGENGVNITNKKVNFFRKGKSGDWKNYFSEKELEHFNNENKNLMEQLSYK